MRLQGRLRAVNLVCIGACLLTLGGLAFPYFRPPSGGNGSLIVLVEYSLTMVSGVTLLLGPGLAFRVLRPSWRIPLGYVFLPGFALLVATGLICWLSAKTVTPEVTSAVILGSVSACLLIVSVTGDLSKLVAHDEVLALGLVALVLLICVAKGMWSVGPTGELYGGTVSRTLEVGNRSDSRISFAVVQLIDQGLAPYSQTAKRFFSPYTFGSRGPLAGMASAPIVFLAGGHPPVDFPDQPWVPFDPQGFAAYRVMMEILALTSLLAAYTLARRFAKPPVAFFLLILLASTPFIVHDVYFTWPKLLSATLVLLAADLILHRHTLLAGLSVGIGYLCHPEALFALPALLLLWAWLCSRRQAGTIRRSEAWRGGLWIVAGLAAFVALWTLVNLGHRSQLATFFFYLVDAGGAGTAHSVLAWLQDRGLSVASTLIPGFVVVTQARNPFMNVVGGYSPTVVVFYMQYWATLPFGAGLFFYPLLIAGIVRAARRDLRLVMSIVLLPFLIFALYWGSAATGLLREGLHAWLIGVLLVAVWAWSRPPSPSWLRAWWARAVFASRGIETFLMLVLPTVLTRPVLTTPGFVHTDDAALAIMLVGCGLLTWMGWRAPSLLEDSLSWTVDRPRRGGSLGPPGEPAAQ
jgi:hypothetical protein